MAATPTAPPQDVPVPLARSALGRIKALCQVAHGSGLDAQLDREAEAMGLSQADAQAAEGMAVFHGRCPADFAALRGGTAGFPRPSR